MSEIDVEIYRLLERKPGLSDKELAEALRGPGSPNHYVNERCRALEIQGVLWRENRTDGVIGNWLKENSKNCILARQAELKTKVTDISEKRIKQILESHLISQKWESKIAWGTGSHGNDIEARRGDELWIIQVKGSSSFQTQLISDFLLVLGEIMQRMDDPNAKYSIALPHINPFQRLWDRLPETAKIRTGITALFVDLQGIVTESIK